MPYEGYVAEAARVISYDNIVNLTYTPLELSSENPPSDLSYNESTNEDFS